MLAPTEPMISDEQVQAIEAKPVILAEHGRVEGWDLHVQEHQANEKYPEYGPSIGIGVRRKIDDTLCSFDMSLPPDVALALGVMLESLHVRMSERTVAAIEAGFAPHDGDEAQP